MERIKVAVSPFYGGKGWVDELTNIHFEKSEYGVNVYSIPANLDLTNVRKAIRLNALTLVEGDLPLVDEANEIVIEEKAKKVEEKQEVEVKQEADAEEAPVKKPAKKKTAAKKKD